MRRLISILLVSALAACTDARELTRQANCPDFPSEVLDTLRVECSSCHGQVVAEGGYRLDSYVAAFERDADGARRIVPGDPASPLLARASDATDYHTPKSDLTVPLLTHWVVDCSANYLPSALVHPFGWATPGSPDSHAAFLRASGWPLEDCEQCHGEGTDPAGGPVERSCTTCHAAGPTACNTCHGSSANAAPPVSLDGVTSTDDPAVGAHQAHVGAMEFAAPFSCDACHIKPQGATILEAVAAVGHLDSDPPAEVFPGGGDFSGLAAQRGATPVYDGSTATCSGVYCHGGSTLMSSDEALTIVRTPSWTDVGNNTIKCGSCHGVPMTVGAGHLASYTEEDCVNCHASSVDANGAIIFDSNGNTLHVNGQVNFNQ